MFRPFLGMFFLHRGGFFGGGSLEIIVLYAFSHGSLHLFPFSPGLSIHPNGYSFRKDIDSSLSLHDVLTVCQHLILNRFNPRYHRVLL